MKLISLLKKGFTLIELLIVIAIIGILSGIIVTNVQGVRQRARDARRKSDLDAITQSLRLYYNDKQQYPDDDNNGRISGCGALGTSVCSWGTAAFTAGTTTYMNRLPYDPSHTTASPKYYTYTRTSTDAFTLTATMENISDPDIADSQTRCGGATSSTIYYTCP